MALNGRQLLQLHVTHLHNNHLAKHFLGQSSSTTLGRMTLHWATYFLDQLAGSSTAAGFIPAFSSQF